MYPVFKQLQQYFLRESTYSGHSSSYDNQFPIQRKALLVTSTSQRVWCSIHAQFISSLELQEMNGCDSYCAVVADPTLICGISYTAYVGWLRQWRLNSLAQLQ